MPKKKTSADSAASSPEATPAKKAAPRKKTATTATTAPKTSSTASLKAAVPKTKAAPSRRTSPRKPKNEDAPAPGSPMGILAEETLLQYESTTDAIAVRAYFIGENRRAAGAHPDPVKDWLEAEAEILAQMQALSGNGSGPKRRKRAE